MSGSATAGHTWRWRNRLCLDTLEDLASIKPYVILTISEATSLMQELSGLMPFLMPCRKASFPMSYFLYRYMKRRCQPYTLYLQQSSKKRQAVRISQKTACKIRAGRHG